MMNLGRFWRRTPDASAIGALRRRRAFRRTRAFPRERRRSWGNEGVGEHVRTRFHAGLLALLKLRVVRIPAPNEEKLVSSAGPVLKERASFERTLFRNTIQPFDLMSRRHPLFVDQSLQSFIRGSCDVPASSRRQFLEKRSYFFFFATLRVFFAVFFTALFAFFAFLAFLAMLPS